MNVLTEAEISHILSRIDPDAAPQQAVGRGDLRAVADLIRSLRTRVEELEAALNIMGQMVGSDETMRLHDRMRDAEGERDMLRARVAESEAGGWQPIETAPRDGTRILVAITGDRDEPMTVEAWWPEGAEDWYLAGQYPARYDCAGPISEIMYGSVTHWMPLPAPPAGEVSHG